MDINNLTIELVNNQEFFYSPIYSLNLVEWETLKIYIENNLGNSFIKPFKSPVEALIFFNKTPNRSLKLRINY